MTSHLEKVKRKYLELRTGRVTMTTRWRVTVNLLRSPAACSQAPAKQLHYLYIQDECVLRYWLFLYMCLQCTKRYVLCLHG